MNLIKGAAAERLGRRRSVSGPSMSEFSRDAGDWVGSVGVAEHLGSDTFIHFHVDDVGALTVRTEGEYPLHHGERAYLTADPARIHRFDATGSRSGEPARGKARADHGAAGVSAVRYARSPWWSGYSPSVRTVSAPTSSTWKWMNVSEPRCSATPTGADPVAGVAWRL